MTPAEGALEAEKRHRKDAQAAEAAALKAKERADELAQAADDTAKQAVIAAAAANEEAQCAYMSCS